MPSDDRNLPKRTNRGTVEFFSIHCPFAIAAKARYTVDDSGSSYVRTPSEFQFSPSNMYNESYISILLLVCIFVRLRAHAGHTRNVRRNKCHGLGLFLFFSCFLCYLTRYVVISYLVRSMLFFVMLCHVQYGNRWPPKGLKKRRRAAAIAAIAEVFNHVTADRETKDQCMVDTVRDQGNQPL